MGDGMDQLLNPISGTALNRYLPHRGRMKLIDSLTFFQRLDKTGEVLVHLSADAPYFVGQVFQSHWLIELMAQAGAIVSQVLRVGDEDVEAPFGFLISIRNFT